MAGTQEFDEEDEGVEADDEAEDAEEPEETPAEEPEDKPIPRAALLDERRKRQEAERRAAETEKRLAFIEGQLAAQPRQQPQEEQDPEYDFSDVPGSTAKVAEARAKREAEKVERKLRDEAQRQFNQRIMDSIEDAKAAHEDFDEVFKEYLELEKADKTGKLGRRMSAAEDPAEKAYQYMLKQREKKAEGSEVEQLKKRIAELEKGSGKAEPQRTKSLAGARGTGARAAKTAAPESDDAAWDAAFDR